MKMSPKTWRTIAISVLVVAAAGVTIDRINYWYRQQWHYLPEMQALPPEDRSHWPKPPASWTTETVEVQAATPAGLKPTQVTYYVNSIGMKFVKIEPGTFTMGLPPDLIEIVGPKYPVGGPMYTQHQVTLTKPYFISAFEVTNRQYDLFDQNHHHHRPRYQQGADAENQPVEPVTWREAAQFCRWLSEKEGRPYCLPTEAQWEYACRAGTSTRTYWGDDVTDRTKANVAGPVATKRTVTGATTATNTRPRSVPFRRIRGDCMT